MSSYRPLRFLDASARADEIVANYRLGIGTHSQSSEMHVVADAPEIRVQDDVSEVTETALRITADGGAVSLQSGLDFTNDSKGDFHFQSMLGATTHMTIDGSTGNVGIGSASPTSKLDIKAGTSYINSKEFSDLKSNAVINFIGSADSGDVCSFGFLGFNANGNNPKVYIQNANSIFGSPQAEDLLLQPIGGNVGIGTTNPSALFDVVASTEGDYIARFKNSATNGDQDARILIETSDGDGEAQILLQTTNESTTHKWNISASAGITPSLALQYNSDFNDGTPAMTILHGGNVGIGTTNPTTNLHVNGSIKCDSFTLSQKSGEQGEFIVERKDNGYTQGTLPLAHTTPFTWSIEIADANYTTATANLTFTIDDDNTGSRWMLKFLHKDADSGVRVRVNAGTQHTFAYGDTPEDPREDLDFSWTTIDITDDVNYAGVTNTIYFWHNDTDSGDIDAVYVFPMSGPALPNEPVETDLHLYNRLLVNSKVGIGTNVPGGLLEVHGSSSYFFRMDPLAADDTSVSDLTPFGATSFKKQFLWHLNNRSWYWGIVNNNSAYLGLAYDGGTVTDPDPVTIFTTSGQLYTKDIICDSATMDYLILNDRNPADGGIEISDYPGNTYRLIGTHGNNGGLWQVSGRGGLALGSGDDCLILGAGDVWDQYTNGSIVSNSASLDPEQENIYLCADTHLHLRLGIQNGWNAEYQFFDRENHYMDGRQSSSTAEHFTYYRNHGGSVYKVGYGTADSVTALKLFSDNDVYMIESDASEYPFRFNVNSDIIYLNGSQIHSSDDRLKFNEARIVDATRTLMKLDPQTYDKKRFLHSNVMFYESGFIAQDVWYDAPELRHLVTLSDDAEPSNVRPYTPEDIQDDPDWEGAGWGKQASHLNYTGMIPHIVKSIQEIATESPREKTRVVDVTGADDISGLVVSATTDAYTSDDKPILALSNVYCDRACFGVVSDVKPVTRLDSETLVNTRGTGRVWVLNAAGTHLAPGDYVTTSNLLPGYAQIQADDITRSSTVAKITQVCDFTERLRPKRVIKQALSNVNYYVKTNRIDITEEEYNALDEENRESEEQTYYEYEATEIVEPGEPYDFIRYRPEITTEAYEALSDEEKTKYKIKYVKNVIKEELEEPPSTVTYETKTRTIYRRIVRQYFKTKARYRELEVRQELVNVLDEHGQLQWEDDPSGATEKAYKIRYLDASGQQTDEANAVHIAAFVGCTYHCG
jgi:hypothetical protein